MKRWGVIVSLVAACALLAAPVCAKQKVVNFWYYGAQSDIDSIAVIANDFEKETGIEIEITIAPAPGSWDKWIVAVAGGVGPDASLANAGVFTALGDAIQPLDEIIARSKVLQPKNFWVANWQHNIRNGKMMGLPFRANTQVIFYDKVAVANAGLADLPKTWEEFAAAATRLTRRADDKVTTWGFSFRNNHVNRTTNHFAYSNGWQPFTADFSQANYTDPKLIQTLEFLNDMVVRETTAIQGMAGVGGIHQGKAAMQLDGPWMIPNFKANPSFEYGSFPVPEGPSGEQPYTMVMGENVVMLRDAKDRDATVQWLEYIVYHKNTAYNRLTGAFFPVVTYAARERDWLESDVWRSVLYSLERGRTPLLTSSPCGNKIPSADVFDKALTDYLRQQAAIRPALENVQQMATAALSDPANWVCRR